MDKGWSMAVMYLWEVSALVKDEGDILGIGHPVMCNCRAETRAQAIKQFRNHFKQYKKFRSLEALRRS